MGSLTEIEHSLKTGRPAFEKVFGMPFFEYLSADLKMRTSFNGAMASLARLQVQAVASAYDFSAIGLAVDIGGGHGQMLLPILQRFPRMHGIIFDLPSVVEGADKIVQDFGLSSRCTVESGNFFESVPEGGDLYLLSHIIHDWDDEKAKAILICCRRAMKVGSRLLITDAVLPEWSNQLNPAKLLDVQMLVLVSGRERTAREFRDLLSAAGFHLTRIIRPRRQNR